MVTAMAIDGNTQRCQYERMYCWPSPTICPHDGMGGLMPTPMKDSAASVKIASGIPKVTATTIGVSALGNTWRKSSRPAREPSARAPSTYSFCLMASTCARVCRAIPTQPVRPMAMKMLVSPAPPAMASRLRRRRRTPSRQRLVGRTVSAASTATGLGARMPSGSASGRGPAVTLIADPGVERAIGEVDDEVHDREEHAIREHDGHDHRVVAPGHREHEEAAHARHAKDRLEEERTGSH